MMKSDRRHQNNAHVIAPTAGATTLCPFALAHGEAAHVETDPGSLYSSVKHATRLARLDTAASLKWQWSKFTSRTRPQRVLLCLLEIDGGSYRSISAWKCLSGGCWEIVAPSEAEVQHPET